MTFHVEHSTLVITSFSNQTIERLASELDRANADHSVRRQGRQVTIKLPIYIEDKRPAVDD
jgi:ribosome recycling factor